MKVRTLFNGISHGFAWFSGGLAIAVLVLAVRSFWRYDEVGYYTYQPNPQPQGRDCRSTIASHHGALFLVGLESDLPRDDDGGWSENVDWYGGESTEVIVNSGPWASLPFNAVSMSFQTVGRWVPLGFGAASGVRAIGNQQWKWHGAVVPDWFVFVLFAWMPGLSLRRLRTLRRRRQKGLCLGCGYDLRGSGSGICPECGRSLPAQGPIAGGRRSPKWRWALATAVVLLSSIAGICWVLHGSEHTEKVVRLEPGIALSAVRAPARIELDVAPGVSVRFSFIPAGKFLMGSLLDELEREPDEAQHRVTLTKPFYMGTTTVTQEQYAAVMGDNPSNFNGMKLPVENVTWEEADEFCRRLSARTGRNIRLPTEAQWEYACRAGTTTPFNTGRMLPRDYANYSMTSYPSNRGIASADRTTVAVGSFKPNAWGLYDMHGNVWQWCNDGYGPYPTGDVVDPTGPPVRNKVLRGGPWIYGPRVCRCAHRYRSLCDVRRYDSGFRLCLDFQ